MNLPEPVVRPAARVLLLDPDNRILLIRAQASGYDFWLTPGGGLEEGETPEQAAQRELFEETGITGIELGPCVWLRSHVFSWAGTGYEAKEHYFFARASAQLDVISTHRTDEELEVISEHRWWSLPEIDQSDETFVPRHLSSLLVPLVLGNLPDTPLLIQA